MNGRGPQVTSFMGAAIYRVNTLVLYWWCCYLNLLIDPLKNPDVFKGNMDRKLLVMFTINLQYVSPTLLRVGPSANSIKNKLTIRKIGP